jgi:hypothetical protein
MLLQGVVLEQILEAVIKNLIAQGKYDFNADHILEESKNRGFSSIMIIEALENGYLDELTAPTKVLWGYEINGKVLILSLWLLRNDRKAAFKWTEESIKDIEHIHARTSFWKGTKQ